MTYNVFSGMLRPAQSISQFVGFIEFARIRKLCCFSHNFGCHRTS